MVFGLSLHSFSGYFLLVSSLLGSFVYSLNLFIEKYLRFFNFINVYFQRNFFFKFRLHVHIQVLHVPKCIMLLSFDFLCFYSAVSILYIGGTLVFSFIKLTFISKNFSS